VNHLFGFRTGDQSLVRDINLSLIMSRLIEHARSRAPAGGDHRAEQIDRLQLVKQLLDLQFVREVGFNLAGSGARPFQLEINPQRGYIVSCELGVESIEVMFANFAPSHLEAPRSDRRP